VHVFILLRGKIRPLSNCFYYLIEYRPERENMEKRDNKLRNIVKNTTLLLEYRGYRDINPLTLKNISYACKAEFQG